MVVIILVILKILKEDYMNIIIMLADTPAVKDHGCLFIAKDTQKKIPY